MWKYRISTVIWMLRTWCKKFSPNCLPVGIEMNFHAHIDLENMVTRHTVDTTNTITTQSLKFKCLNNPELVIETTV